MRLMNVNYQETFMAARTKRIYKIPLQQKPCEELKGKLIIFAEKTEFVFSGVLSKNV